MLSINNPDLLGPDDQFTEEFLSIPDRGQLRTDGGGVFKNIHVSKLG